jgi:hypothetical protein
MRKNIPNHFILFLISIIFIFSNFVGCTKETNKSNNQGVFLDETKEKGFNKLIGQNPPKFEWNFALPIEINYFLNLFGKPDLILTQVQNKDTLGQLMQWEFPKENVKMNLFVENFSQAIDTNSYVRVASFNPIDTIKSSEIIALNGIKFDFDFDNTKQKLIKYIQKSTEFKFNENIKDSTFFNVLCPNTFKILSIKNEQYFYYFSFNSMNKLQTMIFSSYEL